MPRKPTKLRKKRKDAYKDYILKHCEELRRIFGLTCWRTQYLFDEDLKREDSNFDADDLAYSSCLPEYMTYHVAFGKKLRERYDQKESYSVYATLVHEFVHIILWSLQWQAEDIASTQQQPYVRAIVESTTTQLERIIVALMSSKNYAIK